jgi:DNA-binding CsgD family transcriptional regulator
VLLERDDSLSTLTGLLDGVRSEGRLVVVGGEAGVGKTTLLRRFCDAHEGRVLWGACEPLRTPRPLGPFLDVARDTGGELAALVGGAAKPHEVAAALLDDLRRRDPTVLVLEDMHWADEATLDVLTLLGRRVSATTALVLVSYRDDELDRVHPLRIVLGELATSRAITRLKLAGLSATAVAQLAEPYGVDAFELHRKTAGNPFFVVEALAAEAEGIPDSVRDAVLARAARLSPPGRALLEAVAVVPPQAELWLLDALAPDESEQLDECVARGMLQPLTSAVAFRHELARLAIEGTVAPQRRADLHRRALAALAEPPSGTPDAARLAHHADVAGDAAAVLRYAPQAAARATALGAHREAAAQYARALRFGEGLAPGERAELLEARSRACYVTDQNEAAIGAIEEAVGLRRRLGQALDEGDDVRWLSQILWCPGHTARAERAGFDAVELLEQQPAGRELAWAYANLAATCAAAARGDEAVSWGKRALSLAERLGETEPAVHALATIGACEASAEKLERSLERSLRAGLDEQVGRAFILVIGAGVEGRRHELALRHLDDGIDFTSDRGLERDRLYLVASRARLELDQGRWAEAADSAEAVLRIPRTSITPRIGALVVLGLVRARRGDPGWRAPLAEAWALGEPTGELPRFGFAAAARAEAAWLAGDPAAVAEAVEYALPHARARGWGRLAGELADWSRRAGLPVDTAGVDEPYTFQLAGQWRRAAERWEELGCPYEAALALAESADERDVRRAIDELQRLGARPAAKIVARRMRERGVRRVPRGPYARTRENPAGLTAREVEVLALLAEGLRNAQIADRLVVSEKTVSHHVSAVLRKLDVSSRGEAGAKALRLGLTR